MTRHRDMVAEFHRVFKLPIADEVDISDSDVQDLRLALIEEEWIELRDALVAQDPIEVADALADLLYVTYGAALVFGIDIDGAMSAVHHSNMTKLWNAAEVDNLDDDYTEHASLVKVGPNAYIVYREDGKVIKSPSFEEPKLWPVVYPPPWPNEGRFERQG